jgi:subtilisin family serine protease
MAATTAPAASQRQPVPLSGSPPAAYDEILVRFREGTLEAAISGAHVRSGARELRRFDHLHNLVHVKLQGKSVAEALAAYRANPAVIYATANYSRSLRLTPNDPYFVNGSLWGLQNPAVPGADIHATDAWNLTTGSRDVVVMVLDTGIDYTHQDLAPNMWRNTADCFNDGIDHDGNGYINDCYGINPAYGNSDPMDDDVVGGSHGTFMAGIIGAVGNNGIGVVGVNWQIGLMACKAFGKNRIGYDSAIIQCLEYALTMKRRGVNIVATNSSFGGADYDPAMYDAIGELMNAGILFIAPAGNGLDEDKPISAIYPANYDLPNVIAVAALDKSDPLDNKSDALYPGSGYGAHSVHLGAPGGGIVSTVIGNGYDIEDGTSNATAYVSGVAALLKASNPTWDWRTVKNRILAGGDDDPALRNILNDTITGKRLNAYGALTCVNSPVQRRFRPTEVGVVPPNIPPVSQAIALGTKIGLSVLNINCGTPAGPVSVIV